jgi:hypothetical protein
MASTINASTSPAAIVQTADGTGILALQTGNTTALTIDASQNTTLAGKLTSAGALTLASNGTTTALTIDTSQNVGIGTASPASIFEVSSANSATTAQAYVTCTNASNYTILGLRNTGASGKSYQVAVGGNLAGANQNSFYIYDASAGNTRLLIDTSGNVLVNRTSTISGEKFGVTFSAGGAGVLTSVASTATQYHFLFSNGSTVGSIYTNGSATSFVTSSDYRLKDNIVPMTGALDKVLKLKPVTYTWKIDGTDGQGFIAHELQEIVPDCVSEKKDAVDAEGNPIYQGVDTSFLVATLTAAIQEQQALITSLTARITALEGA